MNHYERIQCSGGCRVIGATVERLIRKPHRLNDLVALITNARDEL
jgi:hypothetical protein